MKIYNIRVSRNIASYLTGKEDTIIYDKNRPVVLLEANQQTRLLKVRKLKFFEKIKLLLNDDYKRDKS